MKTLYASGPISDNLKICNYLEKCFLNKVFFWLDAAYNISEEFVNDSKKFEFFHSYLNPFLNYHKFHLKKKCRPKLVYLLGFEPPAHYTCNIIPCALYL